MKKIELNRRGAALMSALLLFLLCAAASLIVITNTVAAASRAAAFRSYERQYASASSAARLIRDSLTNAEDRNVFAWVCLQCANVEGGVLTVTLETEDLPAARCRIVFDDDLNLDATIETERLRLRLTMPAISAGEPEWSASDALIERVERQGMEDAP